MEVTGLRERPGDRVEVEVDGDVWRTLPSIVVARAGLFPGMALDRSRLRLVARELRRSEAMTATARILRVREVSSRTLDARLARRGVEPDSRAEALAAAQRAGLVDDDRYAARRARTLADRARGDAAIRWQLEQEGIAADVAVRAVAALEPELERAAHVVARRGRGPATARYLGARGFGADAIEGALGEDGASG